jgi:hypothetical protein
VLAFARSWGVYVCGHVILLAIVNVIDFFFIPFGQNLICLRISAFVVSSLSHPGHLHDDALNASYVIPLIKLIAIST